MGRIGGKKGKKRAAAGGDRALGEGAWAAWPGEQGDVDVRGETGRTPLHLAA